MGIKDYVIEKAGKAALKAAGQASLYGVSKALSVREQKKLEKGPVYQHQLKLIERDFALKRSFFVYDEENKKKYKVKSDLASKIKPTIRLYDQSKREVGRIEKKRQFFESVRETCYTVYIEGQEVGTITKKTSINKQLSVDLNGWQLKGDLLSSYSTILNADGEQIVRVHSEFDDYYIEYDNEDYEIMGLLMVMTLEMTKNPSLKTR